MNIDTSDYLRGVQQDNQPQKAPSVQEVAATQAVENDQSVTETIDAVKAPRYDTVNIDDEGFENLERSVSAKAQDTSVQGIAANESTDESEEVNLVELSGILMKLQARRAVSPSELDFLRANSPVDYAQALQLPPQQPEPVEKPVEVKDSEQQQQAQAQAAAMSMPTGE